MRHKPGGQRSDCPTSRIVDGEIKWHFVYFPVTSPSTCSRGVARNIERGFLNVYARENNINIYDLSTKLRVVSGLINHNCVACCNTCCNSLDSSTSLQYFDV